MNTQWQSPLSKKIWHKMKLDADNNVKTPLGLISLMINLEHGQDYEQTNQIDGPCFE